MNIAVSGFNGFIGQAIYHYFSNKGHTVISIKQNENETGLIQIIENSDVIINLAGAPILKRWTSYNKKLIAESRVATTKKIVRALNDASRKPSLFISASAIGIYNDVDVHEESSRKFGSDFLSSVCQNWEQAALQANDLSLRIIIARLGVVLDKNNGAFPRMKKPFVYAAGGTIGSGMQAFSFIHIEDLLAAFSFFIDNKSTQGIYNLSSPEYCTNKEFTQILSILLKKPAFMRVPGIALKILFGEGASVLLKGQKVVPEKLLKEGFIFKFQNIESALINIV